MFFLRFTQVLQKVTTAAQLGLGPRMTSCTKKPNKVGAYHCV